MRILDIGSLPEFPFLTSRPTGNVLLTASACNAPRLARLLWQAAALPQIRRFPDLKHEGTEPHE